MKRHPIRKADATTLIVDRKLNFREDYDVPSMIDEIKRAGCLLEPVHAIQETNQILKGNRRITAVQALLADPTLPKDLRKELEKVDVIFYQGLTPEEITELVLDHGSQKSLSRVEIVNACWRLQKQMYTEKDTIILMYHLLARYTGNPQKANEAATMSEGPARTKFLTDWLHGTVGNYILAAGRMGEFVREQFLLTDAAMDRKLTDEETKKLVCKMGRDRINQLASAIKKDKENGSWNQKDHGTEFDKKIAEFILKDAGGGTSTTTATKPTVTQMENAAGAMKSSLSNIYLHCAGKLDKSKAVEIDELDIELDRLDALKQTLRESVDRVDLKSKFGGGEVRELFNLFLKGTGADFTLYVKRFLKADEPKKEEVKEETKEVESVTA